MEFRDIPKSRYILLNPSKVKERNYNIPSRVYWVAQGPRAYFALIPKSKIPKSADIIFGPTNITNNYRVKIPLDAYSKYCICYDEKYVSVILG